MCRSPDLRSLTVTETVAAVRDGRYAPREVVEAALDRIATANPQLNAVAVVLREEALAAAETVDPELPLAGVPVLVKAEFDVAGLPTTFGGHGNSTPAARDSAVVARLREAGAVVCGTTHMPEFGQFPWTEGAAFGQTRNPWNTRHTPGGSSGGSAAAVAAGLVPLALGGDGGGSIRIPASCCGLVGLKPRRGRVTASPWPDLWGALGTIGPLTRTVADTALVYDVIAGSTDSDAYPLPRPADSFTSAVTRDPRPRRIGWLTAPASPLTRVDRENVAAVKAVAHALAGAGHTVEHLQGRWPNEQPGYLVQFARALAQERTRVEHPELLEARTRHTAAAGAVVPDALYRWAVDAGSRVAREVEERFADLDVVLTPTIAPLPPRLGRLDAVGSLRALLRSVPMVAFTALANVTGHAACSFPVARSRTGLPIGVQLYAPHGDEHVLLEIAAQLETLLLDRPVLAPEPGPAT